MSITRDLAPVGSDQSLDSWNARSERTSPDEVDLAVDDGECLAKVALHGGKLAGIE